MALTNGLGQAGCDGRQIAWKNMLAQMLVKSSLRQVQMANRQAGRRARRQPEASKKENWKEGKQARMQETQN